MNTITSRHRFLKEIIARGYIKENEMNTIREMYINHYTAACAAKVPENNIIKFEVEYNDDPKFQHFKQKCIYLYYTNDGEPIKTALSAKFLAGSKRTHIQSLKKAMRLHIRDQIQAFAIENNAIPGKDHVDHVIPFSELSCRFLSRVDDKTIKALKFHKNLISNNDIFVAQWQEFHDKNAKLQILPKKMNLQKGAKKINLSLH